MSEQTKMISIWFWVGLMLGIYGVIVAASGVYYIFNPELLSPTQQSNPGLWWGPIMIVTSGLFFLFAYLGRSESS